MKKFILKSISLLVLVILFPSCEQSVGSDYRTLVKLNGYWKFSIGDNLNWASPEFDDSKWESIYTPRAWEEEGYVGYDGYAWYRKTLFIPSLNEKRTLILHLGNVDDVDEVYINGHFIGKTGGFPPSYESAYDWPRDYVVPVELIRQNAQNLIAVRVYDAEGNGGLVSGSISFRINEDEDFLDVNLAGNWKFKLFDNTEWKNTDFNDSDWETLIVPMAWECQNHYNYDGYAWYRKTFTLPAGLKEKTLYLVLGKIDDYDRVYFNGESIGEVSPTRVKNAIHTWKGNEYNTRRIYKIPERLLKDGSNTIAVRVYDGQKIGGIYEGPIGIMQEKNMKLYKKNSYTSESEVINNIFSFLFKESADESEF